MVSPVNLPLNRLNLQRAPKRLDEWVGRGELLQNLDQDWDVADHSITGLIGFGGEGKSSLALRWIENLSHPNLPQPDGVFWWGFDEQPNVDEFFNAVLKHLDLGGIDPGQLTSVDAKAQTIRAMRGRYLFVLDGLEVLQVQSCDRPL